MRKPKVVKSRTIAWICSTCIVDDEHWQLEAFQSPGMKSEPLERVRAAQQEEMKNAGS